uniref:Uncharacterized protein n=1 Tax=Rhodopseudomonas palustris (strain BisA53) TaxID=316055 RepID=Q07QC8_RHOP5
MSRLILVLLLATAAVPVRAADLAAHSKIGRIFAEPVDVRRAKEPPPPQRYDLVLSLPGYYGRPNSFMYTNYYGSSLVDIYGRLPYFCGLYGYC